MPSRAAKAARFAIRGMPAAFASYGRCETAASLAKPPGRRGWWKSAGADGRAPVGQGPLVQDVVVVRALGRVLLGHGAGVVVGPLLLERDLGAVRDVLGRRGQVHLGHREVRRVVRGL